VMLLQNFLSILHTQTLSWILE